MMKNNDWLSNINDMVNDFAKKHSHTYNKNKRELSASFEIGCFHALLKYYEGMGFVLEVENLTKGTEFRYLTSPSGNPANFSYVVASIGNTEYEIRQQLKIYSDLDEQISFAPDLAVVKRNIEIEEVRDPDFANGKRKFFRVSSRDVIAAHECKSLPPFPELMVSFVGMYITAHTWHLDDNPSVKPDIKGLHLAPTMFVGGSAKAMHLKMIRAMEKVYPINIIVGMHEGTWNLYANNRKLNKLCVEGDSEALKSVNPIINFLDPVK